MPRGSKEAYTPKQKRMAAHIEESEKKSGLSTKRAEKIGWATVNKETGGAGKRVSLTAPAKKGARKAAAGMSPAKRVAAAKKAAATRRGESRASH